MSPATTTRFKADVVRTFTVGEGDPSTLLPFLEAKLPEIKRTRLKQMLAHRQVKLGGSVVSQFNLATEPGETVSVNLTREFIEFSHRRLRLVYEDDDIMVVHKGYGLLSMAGDGPERQETAYSILRDHLKRVNPANKLFIVHRLDRDTTGLMLFAKTQEAKEQLQFNWNAMVLDRRYVCVTEGRPDPAEGTVRTKLLENSRHEVYAMPAEHPEGQLAVTHYRTLGTGRAGLTLVECSLDTGRKNQIRVHMKQLGCPISGDRRYGGHTSAIHRMALHAMTLRFIHPVSRKQMSFTSPIPSSFGRLTGRLAED
ncbi:MAG: RluA family pseudouridine synthase [Muribaculaceae bacterium]|nr:RluA family pseudouridine synthase [Muribaculaceae bacterium]